MSHGRPLHTVFSELLSDEVARQAYAADPGGLLDAAGHHDLPDDLVAEAIVSFADTAAPEVAEHLAPFVMAHSAVSAGEQEQPAASEGLGLLASVPDEVADELATDHSVDLLDDMDAGGTDVHQGAGPLVSDLDFGGGAADVPAPTDVPDAEMPGVPLSGDGMAEPYLDVLPADDVLPAAPQPAPDDVELDDDGFAE